MGYQAWICVILHRKGQPYRIEVQKPRKIHHRNVFKSESFSARCVISCIYYKERIFHLPPYGFQGNIKSIPSMLEIFKNFCFSKNSQKNVFHLSKHLNKKLIEVFLKKK